MNDKKIHTHQVGDLRRQMCRCSVCEIEGQCTPSNDFYGQDGDPLLCERCMLKKAGLADRPMIHAIIEADGVAGENAE